VISQLNMLINHIDLDKALGGKCRLKCLIYITGILASAGFVLLILAALWLVPGIMRQEVKQELSGLNEGPVSIEHIQTSYTGRIVVKGVKFYDKAERLWLSAEKMIITLTDWPGLNPLAEAVHVDGLDLRLLTKDGRLLLPPVHWSGLSDGQKKTSDPNRLSINRAAITIVDANGVGTIYEDLTLSVSRRTGSNYDFVLNRISDEDSEVLLAGGTVNLQSRDFDVSLQIKHQFTNMETTVAFIALNMPEVSAEGRLAANLTVTGSLNKPLGTRAKGNIDLSDCVLYFQKRILADDLDLAAQLDGQTLDVNEFKAIMCDGAVSGSFYAQLGDGKSIEYRGQVRTMDVNVPKLTSILTADKKQAARGSFSAHYDFSGKQNDPNALVGEGLIFLKGIDVSVLPVIPTIFKFIGLSRIEPLKFSDVEAKFQNVGPLVTVESGHISNLFAAIEFEPGGTVDLSTEQIDGYVVTAPLSEITGLIEKLPIIDIFADLKDKLIRLRVKGNWSDPPNKLISKTPIKDIKDSTVGFIRDTVKTGGQFDKEMLDLLGGLLKTNKNKNK
jgi:hypothetical protein